MLGNELQQFAQEKLVLGYSSYERSAIQRSIDALEGCLNRKLAIPYHSMITFGSYTRNTILPRAFDACSDIDILVVLGEYNWRENPSVETCRQILRDALSETYSRSTVVRDFPCVKLELNHIKFDIVPALKSWHGVPMFMIPANSNNWVYTEPNDINRILEAANQHWGGNKLRNLIRLCKHWNSARENKAFESYELEKAISNNVSNLLNTKGLRDSFLAAFLKAVDWLSLNLTNGHGARNCVQKIREYQWMESEDGQRRWLKHLLPGFE